MTLLSRAAAAAARLPKATTHRVRHEELRVPMPDGVELVADRWWTDGPVQPVLLSRTPYGRFPLIGRLFAERGYQVVTVSCRGTFGSGGTWDPFRTEEADGRAVLAWLEQQPWFTGTAATWGASYFGLTQWAIAQDAPSWLRCMAPGVTTSWFRNLFHPGGSFALESALGWIYGTTVPEAKGLHRLRFQAGRAHRLATGYASVPLAEADSAMGTSLPAFQDWLAHEPAEDTWWSEVDFGRDLSRVPPMTMVAGWYDVFLLDQLEDVKALTAAGRRARVTVGPWHHTSPGAIGALLRDTLSWADEHLKGFDGEQAAVRVFDLGSRQWRDLPEWPPPATAVAWHLQAGGGLAPEQPGAGSSSFRYDPADPTPSVGGATLERAHAGRKRQARLESRTDVLTFTSERLTQDLVVMGELAATLHLRTSADHCDVFVRLCDVDPRGRSTNVSDGILRVRPEDVARDADGVRRVTVRMFPTACTFRAGHRIRLQVSGGAHPMYARNTCSGEPLGKATTLVPCDYEVRHDASYPSAVQLPVASGLSPRAG